MVDAVAQTEANELAERSYDTSDREQVNAQRRRAGRRRRRHLEVVQSLMGAEAGRAWLYEKLERCHIFQTSFVQGDPHATSFRLGENNIGLQLLADIQDAAPDDYVTMIKEAKQPKA